MPKKYTNAPEVEEIARPLINKHHTHLAALRIVYIFVSEASKSRGKIVWGKAHKISGLNAWLATDEEYREAEPCPFFVLEIARPIWTQLKDEARRALVDHELCHFDIEDGKLTLRPHDLEEFNEVVRRHGLWRPEVEFFVEAGKQGELFDLSKKTEAVIEQMDRAAEARGFDKVTMEVNGKEHDITAVITKGPRLMKARKDN